MDKDNTCKVCGQEVCELRIHSLGETTKTFVDGHKYNGCKCKGSWAKIG